MSTIFGKSGKSFMPVVSNDLYNVLPTSNYNIKKNQIGALFLEQIAPFELPKKTYGSNINYADRILGTFLDRKCATGVILSGEKGSGKSLLAKTISVGAATHNIPTIVINAPWHGEQFNQFLQDIAQPTVVLFDEFEKIYPREEQEAVLTLLDGVYPQNKLYVFTCNDKYRVDTNMRNRPGRIFYAIDYAGLEPEAIREFCQDRLKDQTQIEAVMKVSSVFKDFNFDMLQALVEEMNRYNESAVQAVKLLNIKAEYDSISKYAVTLKHAVHDKVRNDSFWKGNPLMQQIRVDFSYVPEGKSEDDRDYESSHFEAHNLKNMDPDNGKFVFVNEEGDEVTLVREKPKAHDYFEYIG